MSFYKDCTYVLLMRVAEMTCTKNGGTYTLTSSKKITVSGSMLVYSASSHVRTLTISEDSFSEGSYDFSMFYSDSDVKCYEVEKGYVGYDFDLTTRKWGK